jgi:hypothetical protein
MPGRALARLHHVQGDLFAFTRRGDPQQRAYGICHPSILADHASHVVADNPQLDAHVTAAAFGDLNVFGLTDKCLGNVLNQLFHDNSSCLGFGFLGFSLRCGFDSFRNLSSRYFSDFSRGFYLLALRRCGSFDCIGCNFGHCFHNWFGNDFGYFFHDWFGNDFGHCFHDWYGNDFGYCFNDWLGSDFGCCFHNWLGSRINCFHD